MVINESGYKRWYSLFSAVMLAIVTARCYFVPFSHDEVATFFFYIQPENFIPFLAHADANGHFLTNLSSWLCFKLFGSSTFALRLPNIVAMAVLLWSVYKMSKLMASYTARFVLIAGTVAAYNFIAYFSLCRGYGLSMAFLSAAILCTLQYFKHAEIKQAFLSLLFLQLGLAANLTFVAVVLVFSVLLLLKMALHKQLFKPLSIMVLLVNGALLAVWIKYGLFLKEAGALYYGAGESYWQVTFLSLINSMLFESKLVNAVVLLVFAVMTVAAAFKFRKLGWMGIINSSFLSSFFILCALILGFYLLKVVAGVNYPEDRTGLFFYLLFVVALAFLIDESTGFAQTVAIAIPILFGIQWAVQFDLYNHPWRVYETMPQSFYNILLDEQAKSKDPITIGGHRVREFFYGFLNYNSAQKLNHMTAPEALQMNTDYALAYKQDKPYYGPYYDELAAENAWGFRLLKRKQKLERVSIFQKDNYDAVPENFEYYNFFEVLDTVLLPEKPIQADISFSCKAAHVPMNIYAVMEIQAADDVTAPQFIRVPLNLIKYDWNNTANFTTSIVSGNLPKKIKRLVIYLWNIDKSANQISIQSFKLYELKGSGLTIISKAAI